MVDVAYKDRVLMTISAVASAGLGTLTLAAAITTGPNGLCKAFASGDDGKTFDYVVAEPDFSAWEVTRGVYTHSGTTLTRGTLLDSSTGSAVAFTTAAIVFPVASAAGLGRNPLESLVIAVSDETTALTTGTAKVTFRMPCAAVIEEVRASLSTAQASGSIFTVDVNESGTTIISTKLTIDNTEKTTTTAATPPVISDANIADDAEMTIDIDQIGDGSAKGLKVTIKFRRA
jgi:hypothetical protein